MGSMTGRVCLVTGALGAIGAPLCAGLAKEGATVVMAVRDAARGQAAADELKKSSGNPNIEYVVGDMASLASVRAMAEDVKRRFPKLQVLVNNAAIFAATRQTTADGFESMFGINYLSTFLLTNLLVDTLVASAPSRVIMMTMDNTGPLKLDDLNSEASFDKIKTLGHAKGSCGAFARELAIRLEGKGVTVNSVNPEMTKTTLIREAPWWLRVIFAIGGQSPEKGAAGPLLLASSPHVEGVTGKMYSRTKQVPYPPACEDAAGRQRLWDASAKLVGLA
jgi:NAD(P)-dependent dehydrogenase (short-subunit alcohol dehydrogenase family)